MWERFDVEDLDFKGQCLASQRVVEVDGHLLVIEGFHHTGQLSIGRIVEDHQQTRRQLHVLELRTRDDLYVLRVRLTKGVFRRNRQRPLIASLEAEQGRFETWQQVTVADLEGRRGFVEGAVDGVAVLQAQCKVQGDFRVLADALLSQYLFSHERFLRSSYF